MKLLIAEDSPMLLKSLAHVFSGQGYLVETAGRGDDALALALSDEFDGFVLDIMMPGMDGVDLLKELRARGITAPALFLTAKSEIADRVAGLDAGADDYLPKPFATEELLARVRAMLRRREVAPASCLEFAGMSLNTSTFELSFGENIQALSGREFHIMEYLMRHTATAVPAERLIDAVWGFDAGVEPSAVWMQVSNLRKKVAMLEAPIEVRFVRGAGYLLKEIQ